MARIDFNLFFYKPDLPNEMIEIEVLKSTFERNRNRNHYSSSTQCTVETSYSYSYTVHTEPMPPHSKFKYRIRLSVSRFPEADAVRHAVSKQNAKRFHNTGAPQHTQRKHTREQRTMRT